MTTSRIVFKSLDTAVRKLGQKLKAAGIAESAGVLAIGRISGPSGAKAAEAPLNAAYLSANSHQKTLRLARAASSLWAAAMTAADKSNPLEWAENYIKRAMSEMK